MDEVLVVTAVVCGGVLVGECLLAVLRFSDWVRVQEDRLEMEKEMVRAVKEDNLANKQTLGELKDALRGAIVLGRGTSSNN